MPGKLGKWSRWLTVIAAELQPLIAGREMHDRVCTLVRVHPELSAENPFFTFLDMLYAQYAAMSIRRQLKLDSKSISLAALLKDISEHPGILTPHRWERLPEGEPRVVARHAYERLARRDGVSIDPAAVRRDLEGLRSVCRTSVAFADRRVAHLDKRPRIEPPPAEELDHAIDALLNRYVEYRALVQGAAPPSLAADLDPDWVAIFRRPWLES